MLPTSQLTSLLACAAFVCMFVPVVNIDGNSVQFPNRSDNGYGCQVDFDAAGENSTHSIDFASLGDLLYQLHMAATKREWFVAGGLSARAAIAPVSDCARKMAEGEHTISELGRPSPS